jgi:hypothetical protein
MFLTWQESELRLLETRRNKSSSRERWRRPIRIAAHKLE